MQRMKFIIGQILIYPSKSGFVAIRCRRWPGWVRGFDISFTAKNILSRQDPSKDRSSILSDHWGFRFGSAFIAEENLELGMMNFDSWQ